MGVTLIELIIVLATIVIILSLAVPTYSNYSIRTKVSESLDHVTELQSGADDLCREGELTSYLNNQLAGYKFKRSKYVKNIDLSGTCAEAVIVITTRATGAKPNPVLTLTGGYSEETEQFKWSCVSSGLNVHAPKACRS